MHRNTKYPDWVPAQVQSQHLVASQEPDRPDGTSDWRLDFLSKLAGVTNNPQEKHHAKSIWDEFRKHGFSDEQSDWFLFQSVAIIIDSRNLGSYDLQSKNKRRSFLTKLSEASRQLCDLIQDTSFDTSPFRYYSDFWAQEIVKTLDTTFLPESERPKPGRVAHELSQIFRHPKLSGILLDLALYAEAEARPDSLFKPGIAGGVIALKKDTNLRRKYLIIEFSKHLTAQFKKPLHKSVAALVSLVLDDNEITPEIVKRIVNENKQKTQKLKPTNQRKSNRRLRPVLFNRSK